MMDHDTFGHKMNPFFDKAIIQFSPIRSGSTLVFNILREIFPDRKILKRHQCGDNELLFPVVVTFRHPLDCIASSIQRYELKPTNDVLLQQISEFKANGAKDLLKIKNNPNVLMFRYEEFVCNFEVILCGIERFFDIKIDSELREDIKKRYRIESVESNISNMRSFSEYERTTHWHGKHISKFKGKTFYYREYFQDSQIEYLTNVFSNYLVELGYK